MKILLIGEYSRLHLSLAEGLRSLGHEVVLASDGDGHKQYERDIDLSRKSSGFLDTVSAILNVNNHFNKFSGFDVVQLINPCFITLGVGFNRYYFNQLKKHNHRVYLGAFGDDSYWVRACLENKTFRYSEFFVDGKSTNLNFNKELIRKWIDSPREKLNHYIAEESDGIVACLYEYYKSYEVSFSHKLKYIPLPIHVADIPFVEIKDIPEKVKFFIGMDRKRAEYKGTDVMEKVLLQFAQEYPNEVEVIVAESLSYADYQQKISEAHVVLDQLYSYSPSVNPLQAMAQGKVVISGGEFEIYDLMGDDVDNRPIINVYPTEKGVRHALEHVLENKEMLSEWSRQGRAFVEQYHDAKLVAQQYLNFWKNLC